MSYRSARLRLFLCVGASIAARIGAAQDNADELAKKLANPVASLVSVPFQYNVDFDIGSEDGERHTLNLQPVVPSTLNDDWNLITRVVAPVIYQDDVAGNSGSDFGLGDITPTLFFSPKKPTAGGLIWGAGPVLLLPTATEDELGFEKWGIGPSIVLLAQHGPWTYGVLANHIWSIGGDGARSDVSSSFAQPFLSKGLSGGRTITVNFESTYDWRGETWNVPMNITYSKIVRIGQQTVSLIAGGRYYFDTPGDGPDWGLRFAVTLLFPR